MSAEPAREEGQRPRPLRHDPELTALLRRIALHEETARVLQARADQAVTEAEAALLQRRADEHRDRAKSERYLLKSRLAPPQL